MDVGFPAAKAMPSDPSNYESKEERAADSILAVVITGYEGDFVGFAAMAKQVGGWSGPHYALDAQAGTVAQLVPELYVAYVTSVWAINQICIGIGLVGQNIGAAGWISDAAYSQLDELLTCICDHYTIPRDRTRIISQDEVPGSELPALGLDWARLKVAPIEPTAAGGEPHSVSSPPAAPAPTADSNGGIAKSAVDAPTTTITAGNITASNGQIAVGQNISQTFIQVLGDVDIKLNAYHPVIPENEIMGYEQAAGEVITLLRRKGDCAIIGFDGSGKSTLGAKCYYQLRRQNHNAMPQRDGTMADVPVYWVSAKVLLSDRSLIASVNQLVLSDSAATSFYLVLDDFDYLLDDMGNYKPDLANSIQPLTSWLMQTPATTSGIIVCTRVAPLGLNTYSTPGVDEADAVAWLNKLVGTPPEDQGWVLKAVRDVHCYPGGLEALAAARQQYGTLEEVFNLPVPDWWRAVTQFYHLPPNVADWFTRVTPDPAEQWMLKYLAVQYDFAWGLDINAAVRGMDSIGARGPQVLSEVVRKGLVERRTNVNVDNDRGRYRIYDPLRNYIFDAMSEPERRSVFQAAASYYATLVQRRADPSRFSVDDILALVSAIFYQTKAGDLKAAYALFDQYNLQLELYSELLNVDREFQARMLEELLKAERDKLS